MGIRNVKFVRALWGNYKFFIKEIPQKPMFNEIVYVWGLDNLKYLSDLGYNTKLVSENPLTYKKEIEKFNHKIDCFQLASEEYESFIFLDWDVFLFKPIDDDFYKSLDDKSFAAPLYSYPKKFIELSNTLNDFNANLWVNEQISRMKTYAWEYDDLIVLPNAGFFYCYDKSVPKLLRKIVNENNILTLVEEFAIFVLSDCDLETYIKTYEPSQMYGKPDEDVFVLSNIKQECAKKLNEHISTIIKKDIYFKHN